MLGVGCRRGCDQHRSRGYSATTLRGIASAWRSFFRWLAREGEVATNPALGLRSPKPKRKLPQVLDADEMTQLVEVPGDGPDAVRDRALGGIDQFLESIAPQ